MQSGVERITRIMNDFLFKVRLISFVIILISLGIIMFCLLDPTQSLGKTFCLRVAFVGIAYITTWNILFTLFK